VGPRERQCVLRTVRDAAATITEQDGQPGRVNRRLLVSALLRSVLRVRRGVFGNHPPSSRGPAAEDGGSRGRQVSSHRVASRRGRPKAEDRLRSRRRPPFATPLKHWSKRRSPHPTGQGRHKQHKVRRRARWDALRALSAWPGSGDSIEARCLRGPTRPPFCVSMPAAYTSVQVRRRIMAADSGQGCRLGSCLVGAPITSDRLYPKCCPHIRQIRARERPLGSWVALFVSGACSPLGRVFLSRQEDRDRNFLAASGAAEVQIISNSQPELQQQS
jgi:hypothetical protein